MKIVEEAEANIESYQVQVPTKARVNKLKEYTGIESYQVQFPTSREPISWTTS